MQLVRSAATRGRSLVFSTSSPHPQLEYEWRSYAVGFCRPSDSGSRGRLIKSWVVGSNPTGGTAKPLETLASKGFQFPRFLAPDAIRRTHRSTTRIPQLADQTTRTIQDAQAILITHNCTTAQSPKPRAHMPIQPSALSMGTTCSTIALPRSDADDGHSIHTARTTPSLTSSRTYTMVPLSSQVATKLFSPKLL